jgi:hypothetical protein
LAVGMARAAVGRGGRAAFIPFDGHQLDLSGISIPGGWRDPEGLLVSSFDLLVIDGVPGSMAPGTRNKLQRLLLASHEQGRKVVMTSGLLATEVVLQIAHPTDTGHGETDMAASVIEQFQQDWQTVEFTREPLPFVSNERPRRWWDGTHRPPDMLRTVNDLAADPRVSATLPRLLGSAMLEIAQRVGAEGPSLRGLQELLERQDS